MSKGKTIHTPPTFYQEPSKDKKPVAMYYLREHLFGDLSKRMVPINGSVNFVGRSVNYLFNRYLYCVNKGLIFLASANHHDDPMMVPGRP